MEKTLNKPSNYSISKLESRVIKAIEENNMVVFTPREVRCLMGWKKTKVNNILQQLKNKNIVLNAKRNQYVIFENIEGRLFQIATELVSPSYISFWSALSFYGFTEQQVKSVQIVTTKRQKDVKVKDHKILFTKFKKTKFFGYKREGNFSIANKEKALIDSFAYPEKAGGLKEVVKCVKNAKIDRKKLVSYLKKYNNLSLNARMSFILGLEGLELPSTYVKLDKNKPKTKKRNKKYRLIINNDLEG